MDEIDPWASLRPYQLRDLIAVADTGSLRAAARKLGLTQPSLTKSLRLLETEAGVSIISRSAHGVTLTSAGQMLLDHARLIESDIRRANEELSRLRKHSSLKVKICLSISLTSELITEAVTLLRKEVPDVTIQITGGIQERLVADVRQGACDFALMPITDRSHLTDLRIRPLYEAGLIISGREDHPCSNSKDLADFAKCDWITPRRNGPLNRLIGQIADSMGLANFRWMIECSAPESYWDLISRSHLLTLALSTEFECHHSHWPTIVTLFAGPPLPNVTIAMLHRPDLPPSGTAGRLAEICRDLAAKHVFIGRTVRS